MKKHLTDEELAALVESAPRRVEPPEDLWPGIRAQIESRRAGSRDSSGVPERQRRGRWMTAGWLAAAAVLLVIASSAVTALLLRSGPGEPAARVATEAAGVRPETGVAPRFASTREYERMERELTALLEAQRDLLRPETVEKIERNLALIDQAIAEIRTALADDPNNRALHDLLASSYEQKAALLRQASQI
ncbi:MAG: hypothetical protein ACREON_08075 [Gemmatimonadaceae bacterium]